MIRQERNQRRQRELERERRQAQLPAEKQKPSKKSLVWDRVDRALDGSSSLEDFLGKLMKEDLLFSWRSMTSKKVPRVHDLRDTMEKKLKSGEVQKQGRIYRLKTLGLDEPFRVQRQRWAEVQELRERMEDRLKERLEAQQKHTVSQSPEPQETMREAEGERSELRQKQRMR